ncbi:hypothetical protein E2C11_06620 [Streptomyces lavendulae]|nr:hypothetical protein [Streptomyces lavendulae]TXJ84255.1 hypothetical protein E2C11_06620 [Streptomyces lavendulae]
MPKRSFTLLVNQPLTAEQADAFDHCDAFADGSVRGITEWLARVGDDVPETPCDLLVADRALRLADALEGADVAPGTLRSLGLPAI